MDAAYFFLLAVAPGLFWMFYFYHKDRCKPEPLSMIMLLFILGILVTIPAALIENVFSFVLLETSFFGIFLLYPADLLTNAVEFALVVVGAPVIEESFKFLGVERTVYRSTVFDEPIDGIIYGAAVALGFATLENVLYVFSALMISIPVAVGTGIVRAVLSVPGHALFAIMWGYALGHAKFMPQSQKRTGVIFGGLLLAMFFHGVFNFLVLTSIGTALLIFLVVPLLWWLAGKRIDSALRECHYRQ